MTKINNDTIQIIEERLQNFWDTCEGSILKKALDEQTKRIKELEERLESKVNELNFKEKSTEELKKTIERLESKIEKLKSERKGEFLKNLEEVFGEAIKDGKFVGSAESAKPKEYLLTDLIEESRLEKIIEKEEKEWEMKSDKVLTSDFLNKFLGVSPDGDFAKNEIDLDDWLKEKGGFEVDPEVTAKEENLPLEERGTYLLPFFRKINGDFDPNNPTFCSNRFTLEDKVDSRGDPVIVNGGKVYKKKVLPKVYLSEEDRKNKKINPEGVQGHLAYGTGVGKTTKLVNCLVRGGKRNIILVSPNSALTWGAYNDHIDWLQNWKCVQCGVKHGKYEVTLNELVGEKEVDDELESGKEEVNYSIKTKKGLSILEPRLLVGYLVDYKKEYGEDIQLVKYCPWCGSKLPKRLRHEWFDTLEKEYKIKTDIGELKERTDIPQEFKSDEWWKKRGL